MKKLLILLVMILMAGVASAEMLPDGGFESGLWSDTGGYFWGAYDLGPSPDPTWSSTWWQNATIGLTSDAHSGTQAAKVTMDAGPWSWAYLWYQGGYEYGSFDFNGGSGWEGVWQDGLTATGGDVLEASAWIKDATGDGGAAGIGKLQIEFYDALGERMWDDEVYQYFDTTSDWAQHSISATTPADAVSVHMYVGMGNWGVGRETLFDDVSLTVIPEPMTIGLFVLGGLFLRRGKA